MRTVDSCSLLWVAPLSTPSVLPGLSNLMSAIWVATLTRPSWALKPEARTLLPAVVSDVRFAFLERPKVVETCDVFIGVAPFGTLGFAQSGGGGGFGTFGVFPMLQPWNSTYMIIDTCVYIYISKIAFIFCRGITVLRLSNWMISPLNK